METEKINWIDVLEIAIQLNEKFPEIDPQWISFPDLHKKVNELDNFIGDPNKSNEKILEAIQMHWIEEYE
ncbi:MAG: Fe-S assembly protein IscX [SAR86 cluster bacterium]|jgi:FeS assembly protein IscX|uniref:Fe-S assembly protein IscX n=1 Tax=SAR86 cluster bacterium TaxID=2030880 RepID=A0A520N662_9GAMM|nr:MAG: Fe-S assembly protein IscX [SAR86 cluster bacterium]|tara:strand:- start:1402 stop:1611 length:210 start_codon:yes stop_codon:yes gene_type:complete